MSKILQNFRASRRSNSRLEQLLQSLLAAVFCAAIGSTCDADPRPVDALTAAHLLGSDPLILGIASTLPNANERRSATALLRAKMGFDPSHQPKPKAFQLRPTLRWDGNVNGGFQNDTIEISGLPLRIDERYRARKGFTFGLEAQFYSLSAIAPDLAFEARGAARAAYAPTLELWKSSLSSQLCLRRRHSDALFLSACSAALLSNTALGETVKLTQTVGVSGVVAHKGAHGLSLELGIAQTRGDAKYDQGLARFSWQGAFAGGRALTADLSVYTPTNNTMALREALTLGAIIPLARHPVAIQLSAQRYRGGQFLGAAARRNISSLRVVSPISRHLQASVELYQARGSHSFYSENGANLSLTWSP